MKPWILSLAVLGVLGICSFASAAVHGRSARDRASHHGLLCAGHPSRAIVSAAPVVLAAPVYVYRPAARHRVSAGGRYGRARDRGACSGHLSGPCGLPGACRLRRPSLSGGSLSGGSLSGRGGHSHQGLLSRPARAEHTPRRAAVLARGGTSDFVNLALRGRASRNI